MVKARTWFTLFILSLVTLAATASCGGNDEGTGGGGGSGSIIPGGGAAGLGSVGRAGSGGGSGTVTSKLGIACTSDATCGTGMVCATAGGTLLGSGGPSAGMCTLACSTSDDCDAKQTGAACFNFGTDTAPKLFCLAACEQGGDASTLATKCQGRPDFACVDLRDAATSSVPDPFCLPLCVSDEACGAGLHCNKGSGLCQKAKPPAGDPVGTQCDPTAKTDTCEGFCIRTSATGVTPATGVCTEFCSGFFDCQYQGTKPGGLCGGPLSDTFGILDLGYCLPSCACTSDCKFPGDICRKWLGTESTLAADLGSDGLCYPQLSGSVSLDCGEGGAGGDGAGGGAGEVEPGAAGAGGAN